MADGIIGGSSVPSPQMINMAMGQMVNPFDANGNVATVVHPPAPDPTPTPQPMAKPNMVLPTTQYQTVTPGEELESDSSFNALALFDEVTDEPAPEESPLAPNDEDDLPTDPVKDNFVKLRTSLKTERQAKRELEARAQELTERLEKYEKGEAVPEVLRAKDERIQQLEPYEKLFNLKASSEYQTKIAEPAAKKRARLEKIAEDFRLPKEMLHRAVGIEDERQLGQFVSQHFDPVTGLEVRNLIKEMHELGEMAIELEKDPAAAMQTLQAQTHEHKLRQRQERTTTFETIARDSWNRALEKTKKEGVYKEFILHPTDTDYNEKVVKPIQYKAATNFGGWMRRLADLGVEELPQDFADDMARTMLLAVGGALSLDAKVRAERTANALIQNTKRTGGYVRPTIGAQNGSGHTSNAPDQHQPLNARSAAEQSLKHLK